MMLILAAWHVTLLATLFVAVCLFMMLVILIQKPRGGGLSGAFGGAGGSAQAAFGAKTGDVLTWFTVICFSAFLLLAVGLTWSIKPIDAGMESLIEPIQTDGDQSSVPTSSKPAQLGESTANPTAPVLPASQEAAP